MKITAESELMKNQVHADVMAPDRAFEVLQTADGEALFFSIGTDNILYVTREAIGSQTGWMQVDLSSTLSKQLSNAPVAAKTFDLTQNAQTMAFDLALVVTANKLDWLCLSLNNASDADSWADGVVWTPVPFDYTSSPTPSPLTIADVYLMNLPSQKGTTVEACFVDVLRSPGNPLKLLDRYYVRPDSNPRWQPHRLAVDLSAGSISSCLGRRAGDYVPGIYTFGQIQARSQLIFTQQYNVFRPDAPPSTARLMPPANATSIASARNTAGNTNLFVAAPDGLYVFTPDNQYDQAVPALVVPASNYKGLNIFGGVSELAVTTKGPRTTVWSLNAQGDLFEMYCAAGREAEASAWSNPSPLISDVEGFSFYANSRAPSTTLFAHIAGQQMVQLVQDPVTTVWNQHSITLPSTDVNDMFEMDSFTSHIKVADENGFPQANTLVTLTSTSPVVTYVNGIYKRLSPTVPVNAMTDAMGGVSVVQQTQDLSAIIFTLRVSGPPLVSATVDPMLKAMKKLSAIQSGDDLSNVQIVDSSGQRRPLVPESISPDDKAAAAKSLARMVQIKATLPSNGSAQKPAKVQAKVTSLEQTQALSPPQAWGLSVGPQGLKFHEDPQTIPGGHLNRHLQTLELTHGEVAALGIGDGIKVLKIAAGDFFQWAKSKWEEVESFVVKQTGDAWHLITTIAGVLYDIIMDSIAAVVNAMEMVFNQIKVFFEDLAAWLGALFEWNDILRTHKVLKNLVKQYTNRIIGTLDSLESQMDKSFDSMEKNIASWAGIRIKDTEKSVGTLSSSGPKIPGLDNPMSNWAMQHAQKGLSSATTTHDEFSTLPPPVQDTLAKLKEFFKKEQGDVTTTISQVKDQIATQYQSLTPIQLMQKMLAISTNLLLGSARNFFDLFIELLKIMVKEVLDVLDAPISIPILSKFYSTVTKGGTLSFLDLVCLIAAIPVTIIYKALKGRAPFPDNASTSALIRASSWPAFVTAMRDGKPSAKAVAPSEAPPGASADGHVSTDALPFLAAPGLPTLSLITSVLNIAAFFATGGVVITNTIKNSTEGLASFPIRGAAVASYVLFCAPNFSGAYADDPGHWTYVMNDAVTLISLGKAFMDNSKALSYNSTWKFGISPWADSLINLAWAVPAWGAIAEGQVVKDSDYLMYTASMLFDVGGMITPLTVDDIFGPEIGKPCFWVAQALNGGYGLFSIIGGTLLINGK